MLVPGEPVAAIGEGDTVRMNFRTKPQVKAMIERAAGLMGVDASVFTLNAAYKAAIGVIEAHARMTLNPADHRAFFEALDHPGKPNEALRDAVAGYRARLSGQ